MSNISLPGFDTLQKLQGYAACQSAIYLRILSDGPKAFLTQLEGSPDEKLAQATKFLAFVILISALITVPLDYAIWRVDVTEVGVVASGLLLSAITILLFCLTLHGAARIFGSKTSLKLSLTALFFSSVYLPLIELTKYIERLDPADRDFILNGRLDFSEFGPLMFIAGAIQTVLLIYIVLKLLGVVEIVHVFGIFRAIGVILIAGLVHALFTYSVASPLWAAIVTRGTSS
jgi:hypothetical protein